MSAFTPHIILASSSEYRRQLLNKLGLHFTCDSPAIDETAKASENATTLVERLALEKARAIANKHNHTNTWVIGSDQVASLENRILTKPGNHTNACQQLQACSGKTVTFYTGLCLYNCKTHTYQLDVEAFHVTFRQLTQTQIESYLHRDQPYNCAGSFKAEGLGIALFEKMEGRDINSLIGLPLIRLTEMLNTEGVDVLTATAD